MEFLVVTECAILHEDKFLMIERPSGKHAEGLLAFVGGKFEVLDAAEDGDVIQQTAKREVLEEVGLDLVDPLRYVTTSYFRDTKTHQPVVDIIYCCKLEKTCVELKISEREIAQYYWLTYEEIISAKNCPVWLVRYMNLICRERL